MSFPKKNPKIAGIQPLYLTQKNEHNVAAIDWAYLCLKHLGKDNDATALLRTIDDDVHRQRSAYEERLLIYKGLINPVDLLGSVPQDNQHDFLYSIYGNAVALNYYFNGEKAKAKALLQDVVSKDRYWQTFGYLSSRLEMTRLFPAPN